MTCLKVIEVVVMGNLDLSQPLSAGFCHYTSSSQTFLLTVLWRQQKYEAKLPLLVFLHHCY